MKRSAAFDVVAQFEQALCEFTGAPYCVTVDACTNAIGLSLYWVRGGYDDWPELHLPKHTYVGVARMALGMGFEIVWTDEPWTGAYELHYTHIVDSAKRFERGMYQPGTLTCLSFQAGKPLPIGRGGAILTDNAEAADWLRKARLDGRTAGADYQDNTYQGIAAHCYMTPPDAARGLWLLTYADDQDPCDWTAYPDLSKATWT